MIAGRLQRVAGRERMAAGGDPPRGSEGARMSRHTREIHARVSAPKGRSRRYLSPFSQSSLNAACAHATGSTNRSCGESASGQRSESGLSSHEIGHSNGSMRIQEAGKGRGQSSRGNSNSIQGETGSGLSRGSSSSAMQRGSSVQPNASSSSSDRDRAGGSPLHG